MKVRKYFEISVKLQISKSGFMSSLDALSDSDNESITLEQTDQQTRSQAIVESQADFQPFSGEYGPYFQNFTEMMFFTWVTKHMICKLIYTFFAL